MISNLKNSSLKHYMFYGSIVAMLYVLYTMPRIGIPVAAGYILSMILKPIIPALRKLGLGQTVSVIVLLLGMGFFLIYPIVKFAPVVSSEADNLQYYIPKLEKFVREKYLQLNFQLKSRAGYELNRRYIEDMIDVARATVKAVLLSTPNLLASILELLILVPFFIFFFLRDGKKIKGFILRFIPNSLFERTYYFFHQSNKKIGDYIFAKFVEASIIGIIITTGLLLLDVRFAFLLGIVAAFTNVVPYVGPFIGAIPGIVVALIESNGGPTFWAVCILYMSANIIDLAFVFPILVSKIVNLHPITVVVSVIIGSQYMGIAGMIVSIPMAASLKLLMQEIMKGIDSNSFTDN